MTQTKSPRQLAPCGSHRAWLRHRENHEPPCKVCSYAEFERFKVQPKIVSGMLNGGVGYFEAHIIPRHNQLLSEWEPRWEPRPGERYRRVPGPFESPWGAKPNGAKSPRFTTWSSRTWA
jgi:hypothetical protein